jgi:NADPH:quinone reductase-like Zn-dependent oxidoreductase
MMGQLGGVEFATRQRLAQFIVDFAGNARALLLADMLEINGQGPQLLVRFAQLHLGEPAISPFLGFAQSAVNRRHQAGQSRFQHVIGGAVFQCLNGHFLAYRASDKYESAILLGSIAGLHPIYKSSTSANVDAKRGEIMNSIVPESRTVKAVAIHSFGGAEALYFEDLPVPEPAPEEVLVRVHAAGVNPFDWMVREGRFGPLPMPRTLGSDFSGVVEALGPGVSDFFVGQSVFGHCSFDGAFAELLAAPISGVAPKPSSVNDVEAAAAPWCAMTAWQALFEKADLQCGQKILIHGGAGGVGTFAVQLALRQGAWVAATASGRNLSFLRGLGANQVIDHNATRFEDVIKSVDVVLDLVGGETQDRSWKVLKTGGRLVSTVSTPSQQRALLCGVRAWKMQTQTRADELTLMGDLIANGEIKVMVEKVLPLSRAAEALEMSRRGHVRGKIVLTIDQEASQPDIH